MSDAPPERSSPGSEEPRALARVAERAVYAALWLTLMAALWASAPWRADLGPWMLDLVTWQIGGENPAVVAMFWLIGTWQIVFAALLGRRLNARPLPAAPFVLLAIPFGSYALLPGLILASRAEGPPHPAVDLWRRRGLLTAARLIAAGLLIFGVFTGDFGLFVPELTREGLPVLFEGGQLAPIGEGFVQVMTLDFLALWLTSIVFCGASWGWRGALWALLPLVGPLAMLERGLSPREDPQRTPRMARSAEAG